MKIKGTLVVLILAVAFLAYNAAYIVDETQQVVANGGPLNYAREKVAGLTRANDENAFARTSVAVRTLVLIADPVKKPGAGRQVCCEPGFEQDYDARNRAVQTTRLAEGHEREHAQQRGTRQP